MHSRLITNAFRHAIRAGIDAMPFSLLYEAFYQSARALGIRNYEVSGKFGDFFGPIDDQTITKGYLRSGEWSPLIVSLFKNFFEQSHGGTFIDVGANIGLVTVPVAQNPNVFCVAYEPDPLNFRLLQHNTLNNCPHGNFKLVNAAVYSEETDLRLTRSRHNSGDHRIKRDGEIEVGAAKLDSLSLPPGPVAIKIDVQGAEPAVFDGGHRVIAAADLVVSEYWPWAMSQMGLSPRSMIEFVSNVFSFGQIIDHDNVGPLLDIGPTLDRLREIASIAGEYDSVDVVFTKRND